MAAGLSAYYYDPSRSLGAYYYNPPQARLQLGELMTPGPAMVRHIRTQAMRGFGQNGSTPTPTAPSTTDPTAAGIGLGLGLGVIAAFVVVSIALNYQVGKAMSPNKQAEKTYAWGNALGGTFIPLFTPIMAIYKNVKYPR